jgi:type IV pilus assembly protein PilB
VPQPRIGFTLDEPVGAWGAQGDAGYDWRGGRLARRRRSLPAVEALIGNGFLTSQEAADLLVSAARSGRILGEVLREKHPGVPVAAALDHPFIDLVDVPINTEAVLLVPEALARRHSVLPIGFNGQLLTVALPDPTNVIAIDDIATVTDHQLDLVLAEQGAIEDAWVRLGALDRSTEVMLSEAAEDEEEEQPEFDSVEDAPIVRAINQIIAQAVQQRASDLHIEPQERDVRVRFRLDGVLHEIMRIPRTLHSGVISRLKVMADLNIAERRIPQDGRMTVTVEGNPIDLRVATVPSVWGEEVILRILDRSSSLLTLVELGFLPDTLAKYERSFRKPHGAILVVGPTGSGKSTTLYSTLSVVNQVSRKIITVEDPVEFRLAGMSQIHVNPKAGLSFASALRSILRSDPDVVMVGEIRDTETARIAIEAAMTGHLVFSTLHTNDAPSAITRLIEMQVEPFLVASSIECVLAQRLARKLCVRCKESYTPLPEVLHEAGLPEGTELFRPVGCNECSGTGYRGRIALVELMLVSEEIERLAVERSSSEDIRKVAIEQGMRSLRDDGLQKAVAGVTSLEEVLRIVEGRADAATTAETPPEEVVPMRRRETG